MPILSRNRTITQVAFDQGVAGSTDLVAAPGAGQRVFVVNIVIAMAAAGTAKFTEGTGPADLTGAIPFAINGGLVAIGDGVQPVLQTNTAASKLSLVTATGAAKGWIRYFVASE